MKRPECPSCRQTFEGPETTLVSSKAAAPKPEPGSFQDEESKIKVRGSQSTKVDLVAAENHSCCPSESLK